MLATLALVAAAHGALPFIEDDFPKAQAVARAEHKPLFVDFWATWCHTCLSMRRTVFADPALAKLAGKVVWASIETETEKNKPVVDEYPLDVWPTFLVVAPEDGRVLGKWLGAGTPAQMKRFVTAAVALYRRPAAGLVEQGDEAARKGDLASAARAYEAAPRQPETLAKLLNTYRKARTPEAAGKCVDLALSQMKATGETAVATDFVGYALACAEQLPRDDARVPRLKQAGLARLLALLDDPRAQLSVDDRSDAMATAADLLEAEGRKDESSGVQQKRAALLERAAAKAPDPVHASTYDPHLTDTYLALGQPQKAEALLSRREREMPDDYNPPARLARVYLEEKRLPEAEAAVDRALEKMPRSQRRIGILALKATILRAEGKSDEAALREQLEVLRALPKSQRRPDREAALQKQLAAPR